MSVGEDKRAMRGAGHAHTATNKTQLYKTHVCVLGISTYSPVIHQNYTYQQHCAEGLRVVLLGIGYGWRVRLGLVKGAEWA